MSSPAEGEGDGPRGPLNGQADGEQEMRDGLLGVDVKVVEDELVDGFAGLLGRIVVT